VSLSAPMSAHCVSWDTHAEMAALVAYCTGNGTAIRNQSGEDKASVLGRKTKIDDPPGVQLMLADCTVTQQEGAREDSTEATARPLLKLPGD